MVAPAKTYIRCQGAERRTVWSVCQRKPVAYHLLTLYIKTRISRLPRIPLHFCSTGRSSPSPRVEKHSYPLLPISGRHPTLRETHCRPRTVLRSSSFPCPTSALKTSGERLGRLRLNRLLRAAHHPLCLQTVSRSLHWHDRWTEISCWNSATTRHSCLCVQRAAGANETVAGRWHTACGWPASPHDRARGTEQG